MKFNLPQPAPKPPIDTAVRLGNVYPCKGGGKTHYWIVVGFNERTVNLLGVNSDEMCYGKPTCDADLFALAPSEDRAVIECPACDKQYWVQGGYRPQYTSAFAEEDL